MISFSSWSATVAMVLIAIAGNSLGTAGPDSVYVNAKVITVDERFSIAEAFAIEGNRFVAVGKREDIQALAGEKTEVFDLQGRTVIPGMIDNHNHFIRGAEHWSKLLRLDGVTTRQAALERIKAHGTGLAEDDWLLVLGGWNEEQFTDDPRGFSLEELDDIAGDRPAFIQVQYSHAYVNSVFLKLVGAPEHPSGSSKNVGSGSSRLESIFGPPLPQLVERDESGRYTSRLNGGMGMILQASTLIPGPSSAGEFVEAIRDAQAHYNRLGITTVYDPAGALSSQNAYDAVEQLHQSGELTLRIFRTVQFDTMDAATLGKVLDRLRPLPIWLSNLILRWANNIESTSDSIDAVKELPPFFQGDDFYDVLAIGEVFYIPMHDSMESLGDDVEITEDAREAVRKLLEAVLRENAPSQIHAVSGTTIDMYLSLLEELSREHTVYPNQIVLTHAEGVTPDLLRRIQALGIRLQIRSMQVVRRRSGIEEESSARAFSTPPLRQIQDSGVLWGLGTDGTKAAQIDPMRTLHWAVTGKAINGDQVLDSSQLLTREEALIAHTRANGALVNRGQSLGQIRPGFLADFLVLDGDYLTVDEDRIKELRTVMTVVDGDTVYDASAVSAQVLGR